jgi:tetratricopeptide (TPR) repeat protein
MHRELPVSSCRALSQLSFHHHSASRPAFEAVWQRHAAPVLPAHQQYAYNRMLPLAVMPIAAAFMFAAQQISEAQSAETRDDAVACEAQLLAYAENGDMPGVVRSYEELLQQGGEPSVAAAAGAVEAYAEIGQTEQAASVVDALLKQGFQPRGTQQLEWADVYYNLGRYEAVRDVLLPAAQEDPRLDAARVAFLCYMHLWLSEWTSLPAAIAQRPALDRADVNWLSSLEEVLCDGAGADAYDFTVTAIMQAVNGQQSQALAALQTAHCRNIVCPECVWALVAVACCVTGATDAVLEVLSMMSAQRMPLSAHYAGKIAAACAAHDESTLQRVLAELVNAKQNSGTQVTQQVCTLAVAAASGLRDIDAALGWFDVMQQQSICLDAYMYGSLANACLDNGRYHDSLRVLAEARAAGLMPELLESDSPDTSLLQSIERCAESSLEMSQSTMRSWVTQGSRTIDLTRQGSAPLRLMGHKDGVVLAVTALRLLLQEVAAHKAGDTWFVSRAALMATNYLIFDGPFSDTLNVKFRTGSPCGDQLARELHAEVQSGAISVSSNTDDGTTTYSMHVPGLRVYCADTMRKELLEAMTTQSPE